MFVFEVQLTMHPIVAVTSVKSTTRVHDVSDLHCSIRPVYINVLIKSNILVHKSTNNTIISNFISRLGYKPVDLVRMTPKVVCLF